MSNLTLLRNNVETASSLIIDDSNISTSQSDLGAALDSGVRIATHEYGDMMRDIADSTTWKDRLSFVGRGPGWAYTRRAERDSRLAMATTAVG